MSNCTEELTSCIANLTLVTDQLAALQSSYDALLPEDECAAGTDSNYTKPLHIAAVFIILAASFLGTLIPVVSARLKFLSIHPFFIIIGKCMGIGVLLAVALIHMLVPANESLSSPCIPVGWTEYPYAMLFALLGILILQCFDFVIGQYIQSRALKKRSKQMDKQQTPNGATDEHFEMGVDTTGHGHGHAHGVVLSNKDMKTVEAYLLEFGVTVHSVFVGLTVGVVDDGSLKTLLIALVFHQFFEGLALGSRISEAKLKSRIQELVLMLIFSVSAPLGIGIGIGIASQLNPNGETFLLVQGILDGLCAGVLLYIGFCLLLKDFPEDVEKHCKDRKYEPLMKAGMFWAMWIGAGILAFIGRYL
ncbi:hypothetical protein SAMD00019534_029570 [Acytostelium subglobosum LB1]|uniref:hypothetical protein n=1 Tax=Acytostelium subglobosum LB1 TaxID=1410327 RepID=UPI0006448469|nr:hypothetical protein SAMD00019534_029570 [Acytostelium subglobosum LB1]GAM19782.1 hypothetical protein SAMD00019534_029570 [Acytostelium subglobosum LB1]|eukprot:XP_012756544.1 hypothetical protein SAMD00019534_029570 [Acytostelium subglobosum LB1]